MFRLKIMKHKILLESEWRGWVYILQCNEISLLTTSLPLPLQEFEVEFQVEEVELLIPIIIFSLNLP